MTFCGTSIEFANKAPLIYLPKEIAMTVAVLFFTDVDTIEVIIDAFVHRRVIFDMCSGRGAFTIIPFVERFSNSSNRRTENTR